MTYAQQLRDTRWQRKRLQVMKRDEWRCRNEDCRAASQQRVMLVVHHLRYLPRKLAWEYADSDLVTLCDQCHQKVHGRPVARVDRFVAGEFYAWHEMKAALGFTPSAFLTNAKGKILCGTFRKDLNPDAPSIVLPGVKKEHWAENTERFLRSGNEMPVFTKDEGLPWEYHGVFVPEGLTRNPIEIGIHQERAKSRTEPIAMVLFLKPAT